MTNKDTTIIKVLADLNMRKSVDLSPEQEELLQLALDPEKQFLDDVERLFADNTEIDN